ncbi:glycoside hydrolase family 10 protein [Auriscalpium vulgare]|uniref:Glycoside hydrolase family 10 protein n=1 Tax=Auriscalpium vulgare TaxID=40419 RepID=A0ACB8RM81_9AGAM|nr:glycoside hydrolase family 10 protein [Auriscalpium vulgare]
MNLAPMASAQLNTAAKAAGKVYFGTAVDNGDLSDSTYKTILAGGDFGQVTAANSMKWDATEPSRGTFTFTQGDAIASVASANGQVLRGHNCVWHNQLPSWVSNGGFSASTLQSIITTHCSTILTVISEIFNEDGSFRTSVFYNTLNSSFVTTALQAAKSADPNTKLYINDYNIEYTGAKATAVQNLVKALKSAGTPIDGVGVQSHFSVGGVPSSYQSVLSAFTSLGVEVAITELDIAMTLPSTAALLTQQGNDYKTVIAACTAVPKCIGVTVWDYTDKYSWIPSASPGKGAACPWDANYNKKPAYQGILNGFGASSSSTTSSSTTTSSGSTTSSSSSSGSGSGTVAHYGQCGVCVSPYTCQDLNAYYSQCL